MQKKKIKEYKGENNTNILINGGEHIMKTFLSFLRNSKKFLYNYIKVTKLKWQGAKIGNNVVLREKMPIH